MDSGQPSDVAALSSHDSSSERRNSRSIFRKQIEPLEVEQDDSDSDIDENSGSVDSLYESDSIQQIPSASLSMSLDSEDDGDTRRLLSSTGNKDGGTIKKLQPSNKVYCCGIIRPMGIGNITILFPKSYASNGWGILGPFWVGPICVMMILLISTNFCIRSAMKFTGLASYVTTATCLAFCTASIKALGDVSLRDPGICRSKVIPDTAKGDDAQQYRWCDFCQVFQPPDGAHFPDCNVCVEGYDHHCVWMGTCIGKRNYRQFLSFNATWLWYLLFAIFWVASFGPLIFGKHHRHHRHHHLAKNQTFMNGTNFDGTETTKAWENSTSDNFLGRSTKNETTVNPDGDH